MQGFYRGLSVSGTLVFLILHWAYFSKQQQRLKTQVHTQIAFSLCGPCTAAVPRQWRHTRYPKWPGSKEHPDARETSHGNGKERSSLGFTPEIREQTLHDTLSRHRERVCSVVLGRTVGSAKEVGHFQPARLCCDSHQDLDTSHCR